MAFYIYNAAPGPSYFLGNQIKAESGQWTEVSAHSVEYGTFNTMKRLGFIYVVQADEQPDYDPTHPDNRARAEAQAPGSKVKLHNDGLDGSMDAEQLKKFLAEKNGITTPTEAAGEKKEPEGHTEKLSFADLDAMAGGDAPAAPTPAPAPTKAKASKAKATVAPATEVSAAVEQPNADTGSWS